MKKEKPAYTLKKISVMLGVQYTFLSKILNSKEGNLNEDHLFVIGNILNLLPDEIDFLILLRSYNTSQEASRKNFILSKIERIRKEKIVSANFQTKSSDNLKNEFAYLLNPICVLIHSALFIPEIKNNPKVLISILGISNDKLKQILVILQQNEFIELGENAFEIKSILNKKYHYSAEHPLMRMHQQIVKSYLIQKLAFASESEKDGFFVTFNADQDAFEKIKLRFRDFLKDVEEISKKSKDRNLYQLSFDLLKWF